MACQFEVLLNPGEDPLDAERAVVGLDLLEKLEDKCPSIENTPRCRKSIATQQVGNAALVSNSLFAIFQLGYRILNGPEGPFDLTSGRYLEPGVSIDALADSLLQTNSRRRCLELAAST